MKWRMKLRLLEAKGASREDAMSELLDELEKRSAQMDQLLSQCMNHMSAEAIAEVFPQQSGSD